MTDKVLITGGVGFIGIHLCKHLLENSYCVDLLDNFSRGVNDNELKEICDNPNARLIDCDLLEKEGLDDLDSDYTFVFHLAAILGVSHVLNNPYSVLTCNAQMTENVLDFSLRQNSLKRFLFFSTSEVYAGTLKHFILPIPTPENTPITLTSVDHPRTSYMLSKIYCEAMLHYSKVPFTIFRPHNIYGPRMGMAHVIPELFNKANIVNNGGKIDVFSVNHRRTFCYVEDAVKMIKLAAESNDCLGETINIGNQGPEISIGELVQFILDLVGKNLNINEKPATPGSPLRRCPDMSKTIELTGYKPNVGIKEGLALTYNWYKENIFQGKVISAK